MDSSPVNLSSSPTRLSRPKQKGKPSVTPRRFGRFFTPRSTRLPSSGPRVLATLDDASLNRQPRFEPLSPRSSESDSLGSDPIQQSPSRGLGKRKRPVQVEPRMKRRGALLEDIAPPRLNLQPAGVDQVDSCDSPERGKGTLDEIFKSTRPGVPKSAKILSISNQDVPSVDPKDSLTVTGYQPRPIRKSINRGFETQLLDREHGFSSHPGRHHLAFPACDYRTETASFYSQEAHLHHCAAYRGQGNTIPFSLASAHAHPATAIGDDQGCIRIFNTMPDTPPEQKIQNQIAVHDNAIMDMAFSEDDRRLATACGDRTGCILDVATQSVVTQLKDQHWDSMRQVAFQPGPANGNVIASSDRAGQIHVWDLRCSSMPSRAFSTMDGNAFYPRQDGLDVFPARSINHIQDAHMRTVQGVTSPTSVTAIQWLPKGWEHLLLTGSEADACIKLWDTRFIKPRARDTDKPLATTRPPLSHKGRPWGITSLAVGSDASRLYAVCKDNTIYAYSVSHLMLGYAPELALGASKRRPNNVEGLGPLCGFKQDSFHANSFYVKCAVRPVSPRLGGSELLAVGSSDGCAVLFPTDERYMRTAWGRRAHELSSEQHQPAELPVSRAGTPLIRGHGREVTTVSWTASGSLVTASDDYVVRHWQQGEGARHLRQVGEFGGERHMAGWADVGADWDDDEEE